MIFVGRVGRYPRAIGIRQDVKSRHLQLLVVEAAGVTVTLVAAGQRLVIIRFLQHDIANLASLIDGINAVHAPLLHK